ncbi:DEAD-box ATP-dependent RNA helicase 39 [Nymphaea colorata]|nr:DEAD-box ATP-dependent RNA helicase 39 [Nymphaea colorata]
MGYAGRALINLSSSRSFLTYPLLQSAVRRYHPSKTKVFLGFRPICTTTTTTSTPTTELTHQDLESERHALLLEKLRIRHLKDAAKTQPSRPSSPSTIVKEEHKKGKDGGGAVAASSFSELGLSEEVLGAVNEMGISVPTEIQCIGVPAVLDRKSVVLGSHTGSGKTLAYMLPLVQLLRQDEATFGMLMKPKRPRAVVMCPTRELSEQVFRVAKSISHHAKFRSTMISGGGRLRPQEDSLGEPIDMVVGTPGRILQHIENDNMVYGDIRYLVLDEADTMFDRGFGPDIRKFLSPLKNRAAKPNDPGYQTVLVTATLTKAVQKLIDEEFQGIVHLRTSSFHKKIASARHDFIKLSGAENKLEALLQVLEPSLARGNRVMVFCNTLNSSRAVDHFLSESKVYTVNYHGEVPAEQRVENLKKFKSDDGDCPTLVCTDLAARGLDLDVDHVIMFDFPLNSIDYLHRTGRTARMGAKGKVTSLVAKKDLILASRIEDAIRKNESLESLSVVSIKREIATRRPNDHKGRTTLTRNAETTKQKGKGSASSFKSSKGPNKGIKSGNQKAVATKAKKTTSSVSTRKASASGAKQAFPKVRKSVVAKKSATKPSKLQVVGFRGRNASASKL